MKYKRAKRPGRREREHRQLKEERFPQAEQKRRERMLRNLSPRGRERMTRHHLTPQSRFLRDDKRKDLPENLMQFWNDRHEIWHMLFRNRTLEEIIVFFGLMHRLFGDRPPAEIIATLQRLARAKKRPESGYWLPTPYLD